MILSSDEIEILEYLRSWKGMPISMVEICRCAGGRRKFRESPGWAKGLMARLVESNLVHVNERGHYHAIIEVEKSPPAQSQLPPPPPAKSKSAPKEAHTVGDDYFPSQGSPKVIGDDYFPDDSGSAPKNERWISPQMAEILSKSGKKFDRKEWDD